MLKSHRKMLYDLKELRNAGRRSLNALECEFNSILKWGREVEDTIKSEDFSPSDLHALFPIPKVSKDATTNNNELSCTSLEASSPTTYGFRSEEDNVNESTKTGMDLQSSSIDHVQRTDPAKKTKRLETRSSPRINPNTWDPVKEAKDLNKSASSSSNSESSSVCNTLADPVKKSKGVPTRSSQRINRNTGPKQVDEASDLKSASSGTKSKSPSIDSSLTDTGGKSNKVPTRSSQRINRKTGDCKEDEVTLHESSASSSNSEASSSVSVAATGVQIKSSAQHFKSSTAKPASKKLLRGAPTLSKPGPKKVLEGTPSMAGSSGPVKKVLKGTPLMAGPQQVKKALKGTPSIAGPAPVKKVLKGTPSMAGPQQVKRVLKGTPSMAGPGPAQKKLLRGTPTSSRDGLALRKLFNDTGVKSKAINQPDLVGGEDGPFSRSDYVHEVAQKGFSHLAKLKDLVNPDKVAHHSIIKSNTAVEDPRKTFVIAPSDEEIATFVSDSARSSGVANATFVIDPSDKIQNAKEKVLKGLENFTKNEDLVETSGVAHGSNKSISAVKDLNTTYELASYDLTLDPDERRPLPSKNEDDYGLDDVCSGDSSDDESNPKKVVPQWAQSTTRQSSLCMQYFVSESQMSAFFGSAKTTPDLTKLFSTSIIDKRILIRRSSAVWLSPNKNGH